MQILDRAVEVIRKRGGNGAKVAADLEALAGLCDDAAKIWQGYISQPGAPGDKYTLISWVGPQRANQLYDLHLRAKPLVDAVCGAAGPQARFLVLDESPIVMAYVQLQEGETGPQAAAARLSDQQSTGKHLRALADKVRSVKPAAGNAGSKKKAVKKTAVKKAAKKPAKKKAVKKKAGKKPATKQVRKAPKKK